MKEDELKEVAHSYSTKALLSSVFARFFERGFVEGARWHEENMTVGETKELLDSYRKQLVGEVEEFIMTHPTYSVQPNDYVKQLEEYLES